MSPYLTLSHHCMTKSTHRSTIPSTIPANVTHQQYIPRNRMRGTIWFHISSQESFDGHAVVMPLHRHLHKLLVSSVCPIPSKCFPSWAIMSSFLLTDSSVQGLLTSVLSNRCIVHPCTLYTAVPGGATI